MVQDRHSIGGWLLFMRCIMIASMSALLVGGCTDLPSGITWDHTFPESMLVREGGTIVVRVDEAGQVSGSLEIGPTGESGNLDVVFLDADGRTIVPAENEYLEVTATFSDIAHFEANSPGAFSGRFRGLRRGETAVFFTFREGSLGGGKGLWTSPAIMVRVAQ